MTALAILALSLIFGYSNKMADMFNEHGLHSWFRGIDLVFGVLFAGSGAALMLLEPTLADTYLAVVLAWFLFRKLDFRNHALAGVAMVLTGLVEATQHRVSVEAVSAMTVAYLTTGWLQRRLRQHPVAARFMRLRLRIYLIPLAYSLVSGSPWPAVCTLVSMAAVESVTLYYDNVKHIPASSFS